MALIATVTKNSVSQILPALFSIRLNMVLTDNAVDVIDRDYAILYRPGDSIANKETMLYTRMKADKDEYVHEQQIFDAAALNTVASNIETALNA